VKQPTGEIVKDGKGTVVVLSCSKLIVVVLTVQASSVNDDIDVGQSLSNVNEPVIEVTIAEYSVIETV